MRCPRCGVGHLDPTLHDAAGMTACQCGHRAFAGYVAEAEWASARTGWLMDRIAAGDAAPEAAVAAQYAIWEPPAPAQEAGPAAGPRPADGPGATIPTPPGPHVPGGPVGTVAAGATPGGRGGLGTSGVQVILLGIGALLLVVSGAVFAAVVWDRLGAGGQVGLMLVATVGVAVLAVRLRRALPGTAEALAVVATGLAVVDVFAAPLLGLLPARWLNDPNLYPALALSLLGLAQLGLHQRWGLKAWSWLGWAGLLAGAWCLVPAVATATAELDSQSWTSAALVVPTLTSVGMLAGGRQVGAPSSHRVPLLAVGTFGLAVSTLATAGAALVDSQLVGALFTTAATAVAVGTWAALDRGRTPLLALGAAALAGVTVALVLALPPDPQPVWLAAAVALAGVAVGLALLVLGATRAAVVVGACAVWLPWATLRAVAGPGTGLVSDQLSLLCAAVALVGFVVAWWMPGVAWAGAALGVAAMALAPVRWGDPVECFTLPAAALFLVAGLLWRRRGPTPSIQWLGPAVALALIPSAAAGWLAPWATGLGDEGSSTQLMRLSAVLILGVAAVVLGARLRLAGLLVPGAIALVIIAGAQVFGGLQTLPRWLELALAGTLLVVAGARIEWLRGEGRRAIGWVGSLD